MPIEMDEITYRSECPYCGTDLHVCFNCAFYDSTKHNSCGEMQADFVREKWSCPSQTGHRSNLFCIILYSLGDLILSPLWG